MIDLFLVASYAFLGAGIKYIDQAFDESLFSKKLAYLIAPLCGVLMGYWILVDTYSATIFLAIVVSLGATKKIDNIAFLIGTAFVIGVPIYSGIIQIEWLPFAILAFASMADEYGNDLADKRKLDGIARKFFLYRNSMKIVVAVLALVRILPLLYLIAFLCFDIAYSLMEHYSYRKPDRRPRTWSMKRKFWLS